MFYKQTAICEENLIIPFLESYIDARHGFSPNSIDLDFPCIKRPPNNERWYDTNWKPNWAIFHNLVNQWQIKASGILV